MLAETKTTILLVARDLNLRKNQARTLRDMGYKELLQASDGEEGLAMVENFTVDLVIADWDLQGMTGVALLKAIRANIKYHTIPVILVIERITKAQVIEAGEAGVNEMIVLPFSPDVFKSKTEAIIKVDLDPKHIEAQEKYDQGTQLMKESRWEEALACFQLILAIHENAEIYYNMGYIHTARGNFDEAIICFRKATLINQDFAQAYTQMGEAYKKLGKNKEAEAVLSQAAEIYMEKEMDENAEAVLNEVAKLNPNTINVYNSLGIIYRRQGKFEEAREQYERAIKVDPNDENILYNLGKVMIKLSRVAEAKEAIKKALELNPGFIEAKNLLHSL